MDFNKYHFSSFDILSFDGEKRAFRLNSMTIFTK